MWFLGRIQTISLEIWKDRLKKQLQNLASKHKAPRQLLEREWADRYGTIPSFKMPADIVDSAEFMEILRERHLLNENDFPTKASPVQMETPNDLEVWMMEFVRPIAD